MHIERTWAMPNGNTFTIKPIKELVESVVFSLHKNAVIIDPFAAGACRLYPKKGQLNQERYTKGLQAKEFFMQFINANCEHIAVENPIPSRIYNLPKYTQIIQPYQFGHPYTKKTCLWLKGLPKLQSTNVVEPQGMWVNGNSNIWKKQAADGNVTGKSKDPRVRAKTFEGIAAAMTDQWGTFLENHKI